MTTSKRGPIFSLFMCVVKLCLWSNVIKAELTQSLEISDVYPTSSLSLCLLDSTVGTENGLQQICAAQPHKDERRASGQANKKPLGSHSQSEYQMWFRQAGREMQK